MAKPPRHRYSVGIDLGTSNCALSYVDLREKGAPSRILDMPQWTAADRSDVSRLLPSFAYYPPAAPAGVASTGGGTPSGWEGRQVVGLWARDVAAQEPDRVIASAKSWLAHAGVDRRARLLPWASREISDAEKLSPVEASALYLGYLRAVWDQAMAGEDGRGALVRQHVTITVPASFDQAAQKLTLEAARMAGGFPAETRLLEEPQAAFHAWLERHPEQGALAAALSGKESPARRVLVCDIGGGTTDFSLFAVVFRADGGRRDGGGAQIRREAVSDHILLGGDNIDLALAHMLEAQASGSDRLDPRAWQRLVAEARTLKERALKERALKERTLGERQSGDESASDPERQFRVGITGAGGNLFAQARTAMVTSGQIGKLVDEGFFPLVGAGERPRGSGGLREMGLPYAADTAVTRHLARFLAAGDVASEPVDAVLFNGGALTPAYLQRRILDLVGRWQGGRVPTALESRELDLAVARGAACHGRDLALGLRSRISGGAARSYYLEAAVPATAAVSAAPPALRTPGSPERQENLYLLCILPLGTEVEQVQRIEKLDLRLTVNAPVEFRLYEASRRPGDRAGNILRHVPGEFRELPPLRTVARLDASKAAVLGARETPVSIHARLDALGLLQVHLVSGHKRLQPPERWELLFEMRALKVRDDQDAPEGNTAATEAVGTTEAAGAAAAEEKLPPEIRDRAAALLASPFGPGVLRRLEEIAGRKKTAWPRAWLRQFWDPLHAGLFRRDISPEYETAWLNAAGFLLRPGFGVVLDDYRVDQVWQVHALGPAYPRSKAVREQYWLLWRRLAGGLSADRQKALFEEARPLLENPAKPADEAAGMAGSFERLSLQDKEALLDLLLKAADQRRGQHLGQLVGALGRLLSRVPLHAGEESVLPPQDVEKTFAFFRGWDWTDPKCASLAVLFSQACRVTGHRAIDLPGSLRGAVAEKLRSAGAQDRLIQPVLEFLPVEREDLDQLFGEPLPLGLAIGRFS